MLTDFQNSVTVKRSRKFVTKLYLNTPPYPKGVATLHCEISMFKNRSAQGVSEENCHERLSRSNTVLK